MAKTIQQAEAELRVAALEFAEANKLYSDAFDRNDDHKRYRDLKPGEQPTAPLHPETEALVKISVEKHDALANAARALREACRAEQRATAQP